MLSLSSSQDFYLYNQPTDMRKSFDGLCGIVQEQLGQDPMSGSVYIFLNHSRNKIKLLHWEQGGFVLYYKRLESGTIEMPVADTWQTSLTVEWSTLVMMIAGISFKNIKKRKRYLSTKP